MKQHMELVKEKSMTEVLMTRETSKCKIQQSWNLSLRSARKHKGDPGVTPGTCGAIGERAQVILGEGPGALGTPPTHGD